jgi:hypothetical protein
MEYIRPASDSRPVPDVLLIDPATIRGDQAAATQWLRDLDAADLSWHADERAVTIIAGGTDEYLFTYREARLAQRLMWAAWDSGIDPNAIMLRAMYEREGLPICASCGSLYEPGPQVYCCTTPIKEVTK